MRQLTLTNDQFDALYELLDETIGQISESIEDTDLSLNDYELYHIWQHFNREKGG